ncbi:hypothetical protein EXN70_26325 [Rhizobium rhizogenes]|nr:hypothetical protein EXN70_26325 [Rhizobium rhizogenes]
MLTFDLYLQQVMNNGPRNFEACQQDCFWVKKRKQRNHNPCVGGSNPSSATIQKADIITIMAIEACVPALIEAGNLIDCFQTMIGRRAKTELHQWIAFAL